MSHLGPPDSIRRRVGSLLEGGPGPRFCREPAGKHPACKESTWLQVEGKFEGEGGLPQPPLQCTGEPLALIEGPCLHTKGGEGKFEGEGGLPSLPFNAKFQGRSARMEGTEAVKVAQNGPNIAKSGVWGRLPMLNICFQGPEMGQNTVKQGIWSTLASR